MHGFLELHRVYSCVESNLEYEDMRLSYRRRALPVAATEAAGGLTAPARREPSFQLLPLQLLCHYTILYQLTFMELKYSFNM